MAVPDVLSHRCPENHPCPGVRACPVGALYQEGFSAPAVDVKTCTGCGLCVRICPYGAIREAAQPYKRSFSSPGWGSQVEEAGYQ
jgi:ferredoxin